MSKLVFALATVLGLMLTAVPGQAKAEFTMKFATVAPEGTPWAVQLRALKNRIEKESDGRIKFKLFLGGTLGGEVEVVRAVRRGRLQGFGGSTAAVAEGAKIDQFMLFELPFFFESFEEADYIADKVVHDEFVKILKKKGFTFGFWHENGWRNFATKSTEVHKVADLQKMKMRSQESPVHLAMYKALGVQAESIPVPEVLGALKTGMVDGFDNTPLFSSATGWYEGVKYYTISQHIYQPAVIIYNKKFIDSLPDDLRKIVIGDPVKEATEGRTAVRAIRKDLLDNFREIGITVTELTPAERQEFAAKCAPVQKEFAGKIGKKLLSKVIKARDEYRKSKAK